MRCKQHTRHFHLDQPLKSAVAEHITDTGQSMKFNNICRLAKVKGYVDHLVRRLSRYSCILTTSTGIVDSCLAEPGSPCSNRSGTHPMGFEFRHSTLWTLSATYGVASSYKLCFGRGMKAEQIECRSYIRIMRMETKSVSEAFMCLNCLVRLSAKKDFI